MNGDEEECEEECDDEEWVGVGVGTWMVWL